MTEGYLGLPVVPAESERYSAASAPLSEAPALPDPATIDNAQELALINAVRLAWWKQDRYVTHVDRCESVLIHRGTCTCGLQKLNKIIDDAWRSVQGRGLNVWKIQHDGGVYSLLLTPEGPAWKEHGR